MTGEQDIAELTDRMVTAGLVERDPDSSSPTRVRITKDGVLACYMALTAIAASVDIIGSVTCNSTANMLVDYWRDWEDS